MAGDVRSTESDTSDAELVERARAGDSDAFGVLYDAWFDRVYELANRIVHDHAGATDVAQDAFLAAWRGLDGLRDPAAFGGWLLRIARNSAITRRRRDEQASPVGGEAMAVIEDRGPSAADAPAGFRVEERIGELGDPARVVEDAELVALVWEAADALGPRDAEVLHLHLRHGFQPAEIAETVGVTRNHANQLVHRVKQRLGGAIRARVLWRGGRPACDELAAALRSAGVERFGPDAVTIATEHAEHCDDCSERRRLRLSPTALFSATPIAAAPLALKERVAGGLAREGVPMGGSRHAPRRWRIKRRRLVQVGAGAAVVAAIVATAGAVLAGGGGDASPERAQAPTSGSTRATTTVPPTTSTTQPILPTVPVAPGSDPGLAPTPEAPADPAAGGAPPEPVIVPEPPPSLPVTASFAITPATAPAGYPMSGAPVLTWSTSGGAAVTVSGPLLSSSAAAGSVPICPGSTAAVCTAPPGSYAYTLEVRDGAGQVVAQRSATLTIV